MIPPITPAGMPFAANANDGFQSELDAFTTHIGDAGAWPRFATNANRNTETQEPSAPTLVGRHIADTVQEEAPPPDILGALAAFETWYRERQPHPFGCCLTIRCRKRPSTSDDVGLARLRFDDDVS